MVENFARFWSSLGLLSRSYAILTVSALAFALLSSMCGYAAYKVGQQRDRLKDQEEARTEAQRKHELIKLNNQVISTSALAQRSIDDLAETKQHLTDTETLLAKATTEAKERLQDYLASKQQVQELEQNSKKITSLQLRLHGQFTSPNTVAPVGTYMVNLVAFLTTDARYSDALRFQTSTLHVEGAGNQGIITAMLDIVNAGYTSGRQLTYLNERNGLSSNLPGLFNSMLTGCTDVKVWYTLVLNGVSIPVVNGLSGFGEQSQGTGDSQLATYKLQIEHGSFANYYDHELRTRQ